MAHTGLGAVNLLSAEFAKLRDNSKSSTGLKVDITCKEN